MGNIIKRYQYRMQRLLLFYLLVCLLFCIPAFLFINTKVKGYMEAKGLSEVDAEIRHVKEDDFRQNEFLAYFNKNSMLNRTFMVDDKDVLGPFINQASGTYYVVHLDDEFFVVVKSEDGSPIKMKGHLMPIPKTIQKEAFEYVKSADYVVGNRRVDTIISPYMMRVGYAGNITVSQMYVILICMLIGFIGLLYSGYRLFQKSNLRMSIQAYEDSSRREKEIMDYEVTHEKQCRDVIFGRACMYVKKRKRSRVIMPLKYDRIVWYYETVGNHQESSIVIYDSNQQVYHINASKERTSEILGETMKRAPYAICGYSDARAKQAKHHFFSLLKEVNQNRQASLMKKQYQMGGVK